MILGRVVGTVVSTAKHAKLVGRAMLVVQPVSPEGAPAGKRLIALDSVQAGAGDLVLVCDEGNSARTILGDSLAPVRAMVVGIVDEVSMETQGRGSAHGA